MTEDTAAHRLAQLHQYFLEHPATGPSEGSTRRAGRSTAPLNVSVLDHINASVREVAKRTLDINPKAEPLPARAEAVYEWCRRNTEQADEYDRLRLEALEYRQYLEHAIRAGDWRRVLRPLRCPRCNTFSLLMWVEREQRALCSNRDCTDPEGMGTKVSLGWLAHAQVTARKSLRRISAT